MDIAQQGQQIVELESEIEAYARWVHPGSALAVSHRKRQRDQLKGRLKSFEKRRSYLAGEWEFAAEELDSCATALELVIGLVDDVSGGRRGPAGSRLRKRLDFRAKEAIELQRELAGIDRRIWWVSTEIEEVQTTLIDILTSSFADAKKLERRGTTQQTGARRARMRELMAVDPKVMWSPSPAIGYRVWELKPSGFSGVRDVWTSSSFTATCESDGDVPHSDGRCASVAFGCGVYVAKDLRTLLTSFGVAERDNVAVGAVALTGKVIEHERGYRAEQTRVVTLAFLDRLWMTLIEDEDDVSEAFSSRGNRVKSLGYVESRPASDRGVEAALMRFFEEQQKECTSWI